MKKVFGLLVAVALIVGFTTMTKANDEAPLALTDTQMAQIVAGAPAHQSYASILKGGVADLVPGHVAAAHQAGAADLKGGVADLVPDHVRRNP